MNTTYNFDIIDISTYCYVSNSIIRKHPDICYTNDPYYDRQQILLINDKYAEFEVVRYKVIEDGIE